jgi:hypothetical protein
LSDCCEIRPERLDQRAIEGVGPVALGQEFAPGAQPISLGGLVNENLVLVEQLLGEHLLP